MDKVNGHSPQEIARLLTRAGVAKAKMSLDVYCIKAFLGGLFIAIGGLTDLIVAAGCYSLRDSNPSLVTMIAGFLFPLGFVLIILTNQELCTSNMFVLTFTTLQRRTTLLDLLKNWGITYIGNMLGCLFVAGFLGWWTDTFSDPREKAYAVAQANARVDVQWSVNFLRGVGCNMFVALAMFLSLGSVEFVSKIYAIWIPVWAFVILGFQHCIANFFLIPIGMMQGGASFTVGKFIYQSIIPVTLGNIVGAVFIIGLPFYWCYGRGDELDLATGQPVKVERREEREKVRRENRQGNGGVGGGGGSGGGNGERWRSASSEGTIADGEGRAESGNRHTALAYGGSYDRNGMVDAA